MIGEVDKEERKREVMRENGEARRGEGMKE